MTPPESRPQSTTLTVEQAFARAIAHYQAGQLLDAEHLYQAILGVQPDHAGARRNLDVLAMQVAADAFAAGRHAEAEVLGQNLTTRPFTESFGWKLLGTLYGRIGRHADALVSLRKAAALAPSDAEVHNSIGSVLLDMGQLDAAMEGFGQAVELNPEYAEAHNNLGIILNELGQFDAALSSCYRALDLRPDFAEAHNTLSSVFNSLGKFDDALSSCRRSVELNPEYAEAHCNLGTFLKDMGQLDAALTSCRRALAINPGLRMATWNIGLTLLTQGCYSEGWPRYETRSLLSGKNNVAVPDLPFSPWRGEPLQGKSLLLWPEQGFGDYVQFIRYASMLKARGVSRLTVRCSAPLKDLLATAAGVDAVITDADPIPPHDYWSFPLSMPLHFGTTVETIPATLPYLRALPERVERWRGRLPQGFKVGLVWRGSTGHSNDANRSLPGFDTLRPLWSIHGVNFVSLQKGAGEDEARATDLPIIDLGSGIRDFADTAAIIDQLDLVICVDTAIAHVAGALGKQCWVLLPAIGCDWRWMRDRTDSPWYPGALRLFRQKQRGDWSGTIAEVETALRELVQ